MLKPVPTIHSCDKVSNDIVYTDDISGSESHRSDYTPPKCPPELDILSPDNLTANDVIKIFQHTLHSIFGEYEHPQIKCPANNQSRTFANITRENCTNNVGTKEFPTLSETVGVRATRRLPTNGNHSAKHCGVITRKLHFCRILLIKPYIKNEHYILCWLT
mgnify:CR=1 FL=1